MGGGGDYGKIGGEAVARRRNHAEKLCRRVPSGHPRKRLPRESLPREDHHLYERDPASDAEWLSRVGERTRKLTWSSAPRALTRPSVSFPPCAPTAGMCRMASIRRHSHVPRPQSARGPELLYLQRAEGPLGYGSAISMIEAFTKYALQVIEKA